jgi:hypothetical protein
MLNQWMDEFAKEMEVEATALKKDEGNYAIPLDEGVTIEILELANGSLSFFCSLAAVPGVKREEFFTRAMLANLYGQGTRGAVLGLNDDYSRVTLFREVEGVQSYKEFHDLIEDFLNGVDFWIDEAAVKEAA